MTERPTAAEVEEALLGLSSAILYLPSGYESRTTGRGLDRGAREYLATLRAALASLAAKDAEIERLWEIAAGDEITVRRLEKERDAAENRGFREAADWLDENRYQDSPFYAAALRAEADRREGKR